MRFMLYNKQHPLHSNMRSGCLLLINDFSSLASLDSPEIHSVKGRYSIDHSLTCQSTLL
jgi:hypothetical protein